MVVSVVSDLGIARKSQQGEGETRRLPTLVQRIPTLPLLAGGSTRPAYAPGADRTGGPGPATTAPPPSPSTSGAPPAPGRRSWHRDSRPARPGWNAGAPEPARAPADGVRPRRSWAGSPCLRCAWAGTRPQRD